MPSKKVEGWALPDMPGNQSVAVKLRALKAE